MFAELEIQLSDGGWNTGTHLILLEPQSGLRIIGRHHYQLRNHYG